MSLRRIETQIVKGREFPLGPGSVIIAGDNDLDFFEDAWGLIFYRAAVSQGINLPDDQINKTMDCPYPPSRELTNILAAVLLCEDFFAVGPYLCELPGPSATGGKQWLSRDLPDGRGLSLAYGPSFREKKDHFGLGLRIDIYDPNSPEPEVQMLIRKWKEEVRANRP